MKKEEIGSLAMLVLVILIIAAIGYRPAVEPAVQVISTPVLIEDEVEPALCESDLDCAIYEYRVVAEGSDYHADMDLFVYCAADSLWERHDGGDFAGWTIEEIAWDCYRWAYAMANDGWKINDMGDIERDAQAMKKIDVYGELMEVEK